MTKDAYIRVRCTTDQKEAWAKAAGKQPLSDWARDKLDYASRDILAEKIVAAKGPLQTFVETNVNPPIAGCPRVIHHRPGVFCASCGSIPKAKGT